ncbi:MAG: hypothetical protein DRN71_00895 [Candidatus Nanohalarchaeota archaeon]|nr:MAG: hypothetical protein DRN71_00895 [Candidatus Nanohaloarchaeota archaeon]
MNTYLSTIKKDSKAQISIEFIAGFGLFMLVVTYVIYTAIMVFPKYFDESNENANREEAWTLSVEVMDYLKNSTKVDNQSLTSLSRCTIYHHFDASSKANYSYFKSLFNVDGSNNFRITIKSNPVVITDNAKGQNKTGNMTIEGIEYEFELFNTTSSRYDSVSVSDGATVVIPDENGIVQLGGDTFSVEKIDSRGKFVILGMDFVDCGKYAPMRGMSSKITRFITYNNWITSIDVVYW